MKYMLLIYGDEKAYWALSEADREKVHDGHRAYGEALTAAGVVRGGSQLSPISSSTTGRFNNGKTKTVDGPFAETKEQLGGYYLIETENLEQALEWAAKMPGMWAGGAVEVRPLVGRGM